MKFVFFGTPDLATIVLDQLEARGLLPSLVVTAPDKPAGRGQKLQASPVKRWTHERGIPTIEPTEFDAPTITRLRQEQADVFVLVAYGAILPENVLAIPPHGVVNVHPSLLPRFRGPSPVRTAILEDERTVGVSVMVLDEKMDHGPILAQEDYAPLEWPPNARELEVHLFTHGGALLADILPRYVAGDIQPQEQNHERATYCSLFTKRDGELDLTDDPYTNLLKIHAYDPWPGAYFFTNDDTRVRINRAHIDHGELVIDEVTPEGKSRMPYADFVRGHMAR